MNSYLTTEQVAARMGVSPRWVRKLAVKLGLGFKPTFRSSYLFTEEEAAQLVSRLDGRTTPARQTRSPV